MSTPVDADTTVFFSVYLSTDVTTDDSGLAEAFEKAILEEDWLVLERYPHREMVLDLDAEFHGPADKMTVEYRRVMAEIIGPLGG